MRFRSILAGFLLVLPYAVSAQATQKYFGYFYNDVSAATVNNQDSPQTALSENYGHITLNHIDDWGGATDATGLSESNRKLFKGLAEAKSLGVKAMITAAPFVFLYTGDLQHTGVWVNDPNAAKKWSALVDQLVSNGYLVPGNPPLSTVAAIYVVDEPSGSGLADQNNQPNPALANAISAIRGDVRTTSIPLASIMADTARQSFNDIQAGIKLFDWVGFDNYSLSQSAWDGTYNNLRSKLSVNQRTILVPLADSCDGSSPQDPDLFFTKSQSSEVALLMPFHWWSRTGCFGVRDIPSIRSKYEEIGLAFKESTNPVIGAIDKPRGALITGWACNSGISTSISVDLYVGGLAGGGGVAVGRYPANLASDPSVSTSCQVGSSAFNFKIVVPANIRHQYRGQPFYVYGISGFGGDNPTLTNAGMYNIQNPNSGPVVTELFDD
ncbi:hypothetical protein [Dyella jiangningensis]|uniref:hypothetical protein n=1 Tax=Dyella jiangningensis TaxID=1379159 RepID=UPI0011BDEAAB|nr:hypothetical protein [Dyella jiangningensis]